MSLTNLEPAVQSLTPRTEKIVITLKTDKEVKRKIFSMPGAGEVSIEGATGASGESVGQTDTDFAANPSGGENGKKEKPRKGQWAALFCDECDWAG